MRSEIHKGGHLVARVYWGRARNMHLTSRFYFFLLFYLMATQVVESLGTLFWQAAAANHQSLTDRSTWNLSGVPTSLHGPAPLRPHRRGLGQPRLGYTSPHEPLSTVLNIEVLVSPPGNGHPNSFYQTGFFRSHGQCLVPRVFCLSVKSQMRGCVWWLLMTSNSVN